MCNVQELHGRVCEERESKGDTGRLRRRKRPQEDRREIARDHKKTAGRHRETQGDAGNRVARLSEE